MNAELADDTAGSGKASASPIDAAPRLSSRDQLIRRLAVASQAGYMSASLAVLSDYVGASYYLLARYDLVQEHGLDFVVSSNWSFDLVRRLESEIAATYSRSTELEKCLSVLQPKFGLLPDDADVPPGISRQYCSLTVCVGRTRLALMLLFEEDFVLSPELLREVGVLAGYCVSLSTRKAQKSDRDFELTERETRMPVLDRRGQDQRRNRHYPRHLAQHHQQLHHQRHAQDGDQDAFRGDRLRGPQQSRLAKREGQA